MENRELNKVVEEYEARKGGTKKEEGKEDTSDLPKILIVCDDSVNFYDFIRNLSERLEGGEEEDEYKKNLKNYEVIKKNGEEQEEKKEVTLVGNETKTEKRVDTYRYDGKIDKYVFTSSNACSSLNSSQLCCPERPSLLSFANSLHSSSSFTSPASFLQEYKSQICCRIVHVHNAKINTKYYQAKVAFWVCKIEMLNETYINNCDEKEKEYETMKEQEEPKDNEQSTEEDAKSKQKNKNNREDGVKNKIVNVFVEYNNERNGMKDESKKLKNQKFLFTPEALIYLCDEQSKNSSVLPPFVFCHPFASCTPILSLAEKNKNSGISKKQNERKVNEEGTLESVEINENIPIKLLVILSSSSSYSASFFSNSLSTRIKKSDFLERPTYIQSTKSAICNFAKSNFIESLETSEKVFFKKDENDVKKKKEKFFKITKQNLFFQHCIGAGDEEEEEKYSIGVMSMLRVVEVLHCHLWKNLKRKTADKNKKKQSKPYCSADDSSVFSSCSFSRQDYNVEKNTWKEKSNDYKNVTSVKNNNGNCTVKEKKNEYQKKEITTNNNFEDNWFAKGCFNQKVRKEQNENKKETSEIKVELKKGEEIDLHDAYKCLTDDSEEDNFSMDDLCNFDSAMELILENKKQNTIKEKEETEGENYINKALNDEINTNSDCYITVHNKLYSCNYREKAMLFSKYLHPLDKEIQSMNLNDLNNKIH